MSARCILLLASVLVVGHIGVTPATSDQCEAAITQLNNSCLKVSNGCICEPSGSGSIESLPDCDGCSFYISGSVRCTRPNNPIGVIYPILYDDTLACDTHTPWGPNCYCTGGTWDLFQLDCEACPPE